MREVDIVTGCLLLVPRAALGRARRLRHALLHVRRGRRPRAARARRGYRPAITPDAVVTHEIGVSSATRADKLLLLFRGKATLLRKHWRPLRRSLGIRLLVAGVGVRALEASLLGRVRAASGRRGSFWPGVWKARCEWVQGYDDPNGDGAGPGRASVHAERVSPERSHG